MLELHTDRLYLRPLVETDWPLFLRLHREPDTMRHVFDELPESEVRRGFEHRLPTWTAEADHWLCLVMTDKATRQDLGSPACASCARAMPRSVTCCYRSIKARVSAPSPSER